MRSPVLDTDDTFSLTFDKPGAYGFFCSLHPHMQSQVVVR
jgi:plastocyanin